MPGLRPAQVAGRRESTHPTAHTVATVKAKGPTKTKSGKPGCGSGAGGFKPGNTCGKGKRAALAERIKAARSKIHAGEGDMETLRSHVRDIKRHRRGHDGAVSNEKARAIHAKLRHGHTIEKPEFSGHHHVHDRMEKPPDHQIEGPNAGDVVAPKVVKAKVAKPKAIPKPAPTPHPDSLTHVMTLGGSTGAKLMTDAHGNKYVVKKGNNPDHIREESAADRIYEAIGVPVAQHTLHETADGPVKVSRHMDASELGEIKYSHPEEHAKAVEQIKKHFVADALLGNWDVAGSKHDNILVDMKGTAHRIDNGGSLRFRAQGAKKADHQFGAEVGEIDSMRHGGNNPGATSIFGSVTDKEVSNQIKDIVKKKDKIVAAAPEHLKEVLGKRIDWLAHKRLELEAGMKTSALSEKASAKLQAKAEKKAAATQKKIEDFQAKNPGKKLPKSLGGGLTKPVHAFADHSKDYQGNAYDSGHYKMVAKADESMKEHFKPWAESLPHETKKAIQGFTNSDHKKINGYIWGDTQKFDPHEVPDIKHQIKLIDSGLTKSQLHEPTALYRGIKPIGLSAMGITDPEKLMPGEPIHMTGVKSTSIDLHAAKEFASSGAVFKILADKGTKGAYVNGNDLSYHSNEKEFTLPSTTTKFKVHSVEKFPKKEYEYGGPSHIITVSVHHGQ